MSSEDGIYERTDSEQKRLIPNSIECKKIKPGRISNALAGRESRDHPSLMVEVMERNAWAVHYHGYFIPYI
jgi:hypothetical protein